MTNCISSHLYYLNDINIKSSIETSKFYNQFRLDEFQHEY